MTTIELKERKKSDNRQDTYREGHNRCTHVNNLYKKAVHQMTF